MLNKCSAAAKVLKRAISVARVERSEIRHHPNACTNLPRITLALHPGYNADMNENPEPPLFDYDELKRDIAEAIRAVIHERADEFSISYEDCLDLCFAKDEQP